MTHETDNTCKECLIEELSILRSVVSGIKIILVSDKSCPRVLDGLFVVLHEKIDNIEDMISGL